MKQQSLFSIPTSQMKASRYGRTVHGGLRTRGHRKLERPLSTRRWIHLILKSEKAKGSLSFLNPRNQSFVSRLIKAKARKFGIKISDYANVGNHLHLKIKIQDRQSFQKFLISITSLIARHMTGARRGQKFGKFWQGLAFTRVLATATEELYLRGYLQANRIESTRGQKGRETFLRRFQTWVYRQRQKQKLLRSYQDLETSSLADLSRTS